MKRFIRLLFVGLLCIFSLYSLESYAQSANVITKELAIKDFFDHVQFDGDIGTSHAPTGRHRGAKYTVTYNDWTISLNDAYIDQTDGTVYIYQGSYIRVSTNSNRRIQKIQWKNYSETGGVYINKNTYNGEFTASYQQGGTQGHGTVAEAEWAPRFTDSEYKATFVVLGETSTSFENGYVAFKEGITVSYIEDDKYKEKIDPHIKVEFPVLNTNINKTKITEPTAVVYEDAEFTRRVATEFTMNYFIDMEPIQDPCIDSQTHSRINLRTGDIIAGDKPGTFKVIVRCYPRTQEQAEKYNTTVSSYTVNVQGSEGFVKYNNEIVNNSDKSINIKIYKGIAVQQPEIKIVNESGKDISDKYNFDNYKTFWGRINSNEYIQLNSDGTFKGLKTTDNSIRIRLVFSPISGEEGAYADAEANIYLKILDVPTGKIETHVVYESSELTEDNPKMISLKRNSTYFNELVIRVYDNFGNDISNMFNFDPYSIVPTVIDERYGTKRLTITQMTQKTADDNNKRYEWDKTYHKVKAGDPELNTKGYTTNNGDEVKLRFSIPVKKEYQNTIASIEDILLVRITSNVPDIAFAPSKITIKAGNEWYGMITRKAYSDIRSSNPDVDELPNLNVYLDALCDDNGKVISKFNGYNEPISLNQDKSRNGYFSFYAYEIGKYKLRFKVDPTNRYYSSYNFDEGYAYLPLEVIEKVTPVATFSEKEMIIAQGQKTIEPSINIIDANGDDISSHYNIIYKGYLVKYIYWETYESDATTSILKDYKYDANYQYVSTTGKLNTNAPIGTYNIYAILVPKESNDYESTAISYSIKIYDSKWDYYISKTQDKDYGKLLFSTRSTDYTTIEGGTTLDGVPGLKIKIGSIGNNNFTIRYNNSNKGYYLVGSATELDPLKKDGNNKTYYPTGGMFVELLPITNGFVTIDAEWVAGREYILVDSEGKAVNDPYIPSTSGRASYTFKYPVRATDRYFMYLRPYEGYYRDNDRLRLYGINFDPAFISTPNDLKSITQATAYLNINKRIVYNYKNEPTGEEDVYVMHKDGLPWIIHSETDYVDHYPQNLADGRKGTKWVDIAKDGIFTLKHSTIDKTGEYAIANQHNDGESREYGVTKTGQPVDQQSLRIYAKVKSAWDESIYKQVYYDLIIRSIPTYMVPEGFTPDVKQKITAVDGITMTWGGWNDKDEIAYTKDDHELQDAWKESKIDTYGMNTETVDGFKFMCAMGGDSNAKDEINQNFIPGSKNFYSLPCRGDYVKLEPTKPGTIYLYVVQNGCVEWNGESSYSKGENDRVRWRPLYIVDEHGEAVPLNTKARFGKQTGTGINSGAYTESKYRANNSLLEGVDAENDPDGYPFTFDASSIESNQMSYFTDSKYWPADAKRKPQSVIKIGNGGYILISKGYVRYTFDVLPGKSYYIFQISSKMGMAGFSFNAKDEEPDEITISAKESFDAVNIQHANVTYERKLKKDGYNAFILPFSMNEDQVKKYFGEGTKFLSFKDAKTNTNDLNFIQHYYQMVIAGEPCLIKPTFVNTEAQPDEDGWVNSIKIENVSFDARAPRTFYSTDGDWMFEGNYDYGHTLKANSYYVSNNNLYRYADEGHWVNAFYSFLEPTGFANSKVNFLLKFGDVNGDTEETITGIEDIYTGDIDSIKDSNGFTIYNLQGQKLQYKNQSEVPAGIYIINGKKMIVK